MVPVGIVSSIPCTVQSIIMFQSDSVSIILCWGSKTMVCIGLGGFFCNITRVFFTAISVLDVQQVSLSVLLR